MKMKPKSKLALVTARAVAKRQAPIKKRFIEALQLVPSVVYASKVAGCDRSRAYQWRKTDSEFAAAWDEALQQSVDQVEARAFLACLQGSLDSTATINMIQFMLRARRKETYGENFPQSVTGGVIILPAKKEGPE